MAAPKKVDYARIEPGWRAGLLSVAQLAELYTQETGVACSNAAVHKHFTKRGVPRNLGSQIASQAAAIVRESIATDEAEDATGEGEGFDGFTKVDGKVNTKAEKEIVDSNAKAVAIVLIGHRKLIAQSVALTKKLLKECDEAGNKLALPARIKGNKDLADTVKTLVGLQREAFGVANLAPSDGVEDKPPNKVENPAAYYAWFAAQGAKP